MFFFFSFMIITIIATIIVSLFVLLKIIPW